MLIGYARVSTADQKLDLQNDALTKAGCERIFTDTASGANAARTGLEQALAFARQGDTILVWKLDRLGRSLRHLVETLADLRGRGIGFRSLQESIDTTTSGGNLAGSSAIREGLSVPGPGPLVGTFRPRPHARLDYFGGENRIRAEGPPRDAAGWAAVRQARAIGMAGEGSRSAGGAARRGAFAKPSRTLRPVPHV
jgi:hypothetical protein